MSDDRLSAIRSRVEAATPGLPRVDSLTTLPEALVHQVLREDIPYLLAEVERLAKLRDDWESEALRYCQNADFWREKFESQIAVERLSRGDGE